MNFTSLVDKYLKHPLASDYMIGLSNGNREAQLEYDRILKDAERKARKHVADWFHEAGDRIELDTYQGFEFDCDVPEEPARTAFVGPVESIQVRFHGDEQELEETDDILTFTCKFCGVESELLSDTGYHQESPVCPDCWDERLRVTE